MNIYNFIYAYFYNKAGYPGPGRMYGSGNVLIVLFIHVLFVFEIIYCVTDYKIDIFPELGGSLFHRKQVNFIYSIPFLVITWFFYNNKRTDRILEEFNNRDEYVMQGDTTRIITYLAIPFLLTILLICLKQYEII
jgi:hypothetical protein